MKHIPYPHLEEGKTYFVYANMPPRPSGWNRVKLAKLHRYNGGMVTEDWFSWYELTEDEMCRRIMDIV